MIQSKFNTYKNYFITDPTVENSELAGKIEQLLDEPAMQKLRASILFMVQKIPNKLNRVKLAKHLFYADGHFYQKFGRSIHSIPYLHIEGSPQPLMFNELINIIIKSGALKVTPQIATEMVKKQPITVLKGLVFDTTADFDMREIDAKIDKEELRVMNSIALTLNGDLNLETRYFPNLYQAYAQTDLYGVIPFMQFADRRRPHLSWKAWSNKVFRMMWD